MRILPRILLLGGALLCMPLHAAETTVAVASNFSAAMQEIAAAFSRDTDHSARLAFGSSGKFYAQIRNGAPFEVFLSADQSKPGALERDGLVVTGSRFTYALGTLTLWSPDPDLVDAKGEVLTQGRFRRLSIANPGLAPYGAAAIQVLQHLGIEETTRDKRVQGENIAQAYQFVHSGNAELGFVALSQLVRHGKLRGGSVWQVPPTYYQPIRQDAVLLKSGENSEAALALVRFLQSPAARAIIAKYGYGMPEVAR